MTFTVNVLGFVELLLTIHLVLWCFKNTSTFPVLGGCPKTSLKCVARLISQSILSVCCPGNWNQGILNYIPNLLPKAGHKPAVLLEFFQIAGIVGKFYHTWLSVLSLTEFYYNKILILFCMTNVVLFKKSLLIWDHEDTCYFLKALLFYLHI